MTVGTEPRGAPLVLYVDDEIANRIVFEQSLAPDFRIVTAASGAAAIEILAQQDVAVLVTDMRMPGMTGDELLRIAKERWPQTIRIVVTAFSDVDPILAAINDGLVARYIVKPWELDELAQTLRWATEAWSFGRESAGLQRRLLETERLATLGSIAGMLAHDLKQPMSTLTLYLEMLGDLAEHAPTLRYALDHVHTPDKQRAIGMVESLPQLSNDLKTSLRQLGALITNLQAFSRPRDREAKSVDPRQVIRDALKRCHETTLETVIEDVYLGPDKLPAVRIARTELTQVLMNLVENAVQSIVAKGERTGRVTIDAHVEGDVVVIDVKDTGAGMTPEVLRRVGTPFFTTKSEGTGLGFANCQRLIGSAGGRIKLDSVVGRGTTVTLILPIAPREPG